MEGQNFTITCASPLNAQPRYHDGVTSSRTREGIDGRKQEESRTVHTWHPAVKIDGAADVHSGIQHSRKNGQGPRDGSQPRVSTKSESGKAKQQENACYQESEPNPETTLAAVEMTIEPEWRLLPSRSSPLAALVVTSQGMARSLFM